MAKFKGKYRIESIRLKGHDYGSDGAYFITICTHRKRNFFGFITEGIVYLSEIGLLAKKFWEEIPIHFPHAILDEFVIMPDHMHGIIILKSSSPSGVMNNICDGERGVEKIQPKPGSIPVIVGSFKSVVTKFARKMNADFRWQTGYHDWVIRSSEHLQNTRKYVLDNPYVWSEKKDTFL